MADSRNATLKFYPQHKNCLEVLDKSVTNSFDRLGKFIAQFSKFSDVNVYGSIANHFNSLPQTISMIFSWPPYRI